MTAFEEIDDLLRTRDGGDVTENESKVAVVTGATSGIGAAIAERFIEAGMT